MESRRRHHGDLWPARVVDDAVTDVDVQPVGRSDHLGLLRRFSSSTTFRPITICGPPSNGLFLGLTTAPTSHAITLRRPTRSALIWLFRDFFINATMCSTASSGLQTTMQLNSASKTGLTLRETRRLCVHGERPTAVSPAVSTPVLRHGLVDRSTARATACCRHRNRETEQRSERCLQGNL